MRVIGVHAYMIYEDEQGKPVHSVLLNHRLAPEEDIAITQTRGFKVEPIDVGDGLNYLPDGSQLLTIHIKPKS